MHQADSVQKITIYPILIISLFFFYFTAATPVNYWPQFIVGWSIFGFLYLLYRLNPKRGIWRLILLIGASYLLLRYFFWRTFFTLTFADPLSFLASFALYLAEVYAMIIFFLGIFVSAHPIKRKPVPLPDDPLQCPTVDILIPTYNEPKELLEQTLICAVNIRYPKDRFKVYLLDDGGTDQRCNHPDPSIAQEAKRRRAELSELAASYNAYYIARKQNDHAKAGNINYALNYTNGDLILILDADHAPTIDILQKTVGFFLQDEKLFLVQTPHFFINPDPIEKNLRVFGKIPSENEMFYFNIQHGLDFWNSSFFCGSAAILRRKYLIEAGGIAGKTITEDAETALGLHAKGYNSVYLGYPMVSGLQPQTFTDFINQRIRWAQGMTQILLMKNPLCQHGLLPYQRLCYLNSSFFWLFAFSRLTFLVAPVCYLIFGLYIYNAYIYEIFAYTLPYLFSTVLVSNYLYGKTRKPFISELYELMQSFFLIPALWQVFRSPTAPKFKVTPKIADLSHDFISDLFPPFYIAYILLLCALVAAVYRYIYYPTEYWTIIITVLWTIINIVLLNGAIGALYERRQLRAQPRIPTNIPALLRVDNHITIPCRISDISVNGCMIKIYYGDYEYIKEQINRAKLFFYNDLFDKYYQFDIEFRYHHLFPVKDTIAIGIKFKIKTKEEYIDAVLLALGDSKRWQEIVSSHHYPSQILKSFLFIVSIGFREMLAHFLKVISEIYQKLYAKICNIYMMKYIINLFRSSLRK